MAEVPTTEPREIVAGDTWEWKRSLSDYPANASPAWVLTYYFRSREGEFSIQAAADGADHSVSVTKTTTSAYYAGLYEWTAKVDNGTKRHDVGRGLTTIKPDPTKTGKGFDPRSHARKMLDQIEAALEAFSIGVKSYTIGSRQMTKDDMSEIIKMKQTYQAEVVREDAATRLASGLGGGGKISVRF